jgi:hypothetical protein
MARSDGGDEGDDGTGEAPSGGEGRGAGVREVGQQKAAPKTNPGSERTARDTGPRDAVGRDADRRAEEAARQAAEAELGRDGRQGVSEGLRKALASGIRMALSADDVIRDAVPREVLSHVMRQTDSAKDEVVRVVGVQIRKFLENLDIAGEVQKILTSVSFEVRTEIRFIPNDQGVMPKPRVKVKSAARGPGARGEGDDVAPPSAKAEAGKSTDRPRKSRLGAAVDKALGVFTRELEDDEDVLEPAPPEGE